MRRGTILAVAVLLGATACQADYIQDIVNQVRMDSYTAFLDSKLHAHDGDNRGNGAAHDAAQTDIYNTFASLGLAASRDPFTYGGSTYYNVTGIRWGVNPNTYVIVGAHYDSVSNPGADDDASGVAGVLEAARVLSNYSFENTLVFVAFDLEEQGLIGSAAWAAAHASATIAGMLELDMIAYNSGGANTARLYTVSGTANTASTALATSIANYSGGLSAAALGAINLSDHASFDSRGPSVLLIEPSGNPYYHTLSDSVNTPGYIDYGYATRMTRSAVGWMLLEAGNEVPEPGTILLVGLGLALVVVVRRSVRA